MLYHYDIYYNYTILYGNYMSIISLCTPIGIRIVVSSIYQLETFGQSLPVWVSASTPGHEHGWLAVASFLQLGLADYFFSIFSFWETVEMSKVGCSDRRNLSFWSWKGATKGGG